MQSFTSIPFKTEKHHGLSEVNGIAKFSAAGIVLEFEAKLFGLISNGVKEERLAIGDILDVKFRKGILKRGAKIEVRAKTLAAMVKLPNEQGKLVMKIAAADFDRARDAVERLQRDIAETVASLQPAHTPVSVLFEDGDGETDERP